MNTVYFDHAATTPLDNGVFEVMKPYFLEEFGNANSAHQLGNNAKVAVEEARETIAEHIGAAPAEIIFTSGGTESDNAAIKGVLGATGKKEVITSPLEHHAVLHTVEAAKRKGVTPVYVEADERGIITPQAIADAITEETALVSIMHVNNELGTINPIKEIAEVCHEHGVLFHSDTVQSVGKLPVDVDELGVDLLSISGHKIYGPKGVGVLYIRHASPWLPWMHGGSQERRRRGGTLNVPGIMGLAKAIELVEKNRAEDFQRCARIRKKLVNGLQSQFGDIVSTNADCDDCVPHIINLSIKSTGSEGLDGEMLLLNLDMEGIYVSNGSACTSGAVEPSHVLSCIGLDEHLANASVRLSFGRNNTEQQIDYFLEKLEEVLPRMQPTVF